MKYMNDYDLSSAVVRFDRAGCVERHRVACIVANLADWADRNSDGWCYWPKPVRAAAKAMALIESTTSAANREQEYNDATPAEVRAALAPIKAFMTRQNLPHGERVRILSGVRA